MTTASTTSLGVSGQSATLDDHRERVLELLRRLDRLGRRTEQFLAMQLQQLELAVEEFEQERAAWERQCAREAEQIQRQKEQLARAWEQLREQGGKGSFKNFFARTAEAPLPSSTAGSKEKSPVIDHRHAAPLRLLLEPGGAGAMQVGLVLFEISKLNRELGGEGVRFELTDCRLIPRRRHDDPTGDASRAAFELEAFSRAPLVATRETEDDRRELARRLEIWQEFKSRLMMSSLVESKLGQTFRKLEKAPADDPARKLILEAARRADDANLKLYENNRFRRRADELQGSDPVAQQLDRLERCVQCLHQEVGLRLCPTLL